MSGTEMSRRGFLKAAGERTAALAALGLPAFSNMRPGHSAETQPNIVLIMADDLGYGHLGCYGQKIIQTPNIDRLAQEGVKFSQAYAGCSVCAPSRSVLMTGTHSGHTPVRGNTGGISLRKEDRTFAQTLQEAGYTTGLFGKWGLGDAETPGVPNKKGFDEFLGYLDQKHAHFYYTDYLWKNEERYILPGNRDGKQGQYTHDVIQDEALDFIRRSKDKPFFCFLSLTIPHHEFIVPEESLEMYSGKFEESPKEYRWRQGYAHPKEPKATMAAMITHMDKGVGQVVDLLDELGLTENTLVLFVSDNGAGDYEQACPEFFQANAPLRDYKGTLYEGGLRVPAVASWPGRIEPGTESDHVWYFGDLGPTFAELAGASAEAPDGLSMAPSLLGETGAGRSQEAHDFLYWELGVNEPERAARMGDWKAVWPKAAGPVELYNLAKDIGEREDVADQHPDVVKAMKDLMEKNHVDPPPQIEPEAQDARYYR